MKNLIDWCMYGRRPYRLHLKPVGSSFPSKAGHWPERLFMGVYQLPDDKGRLFAIQATDKRGNPVPIDLSNSAADSSDTTIVQATLVKDPGNVPAGTYLSVQAVGKLGTAQVHVKVNNLVGTQDVEVIAGDAATINLNPTGDPFDANPPAPTS